MAEKLGGAEYEVGMDISKLLVGTEKLNKRLDSTEKRFKSTDKIVNKFNKSTDQATKKMGEFSRKAGMAGIQIEQLVGSINGGQNAMRAIGFQATDLGYVLGFPLAGAIAGVSASMVSVFAPALLGGKDSVKILDESIENLNKTLTDTDGLKLFTEEIKKLAKESESAARLAVMAAEQSAKKAGDAAVGAIKESFDDAFDVGGFFGSMDSLTAIAGTAGATGSSISASYRELGEQFGLTGKEAREAGMEILVSLKRMEQSISAGLPSASQDVIAFQENLERLAKTSKGENKTKLLEFATTIQEYAQKARSAAEMSEFLNKTLKETKLNLPTEKTVEYSTAIDDVNKGLVGQITALIAGEEAAFRYATAQRLGLTNAEELTEETKAYITALFNVKRAKEAEAEADKNKEQSVRREQQIIDKLDQQIAQRQMTKTEYQEFLLMQQLGIENEGQMTDAVRTRLELLRTLNAEQGTFSEGFLEQMEALRESADNVGHSLGKAFGGNVTSAVDNLSSGIADAVMNQESLGDAVKETARAFVRDMIASLVKVAAQKAINFAIEQTMGVAATTASATMAGTLAAAWAPAAAFASLAMAGTNAAPAAAGIAGTFALTEGLAIAGGKFNGGHVAGGSMYRVGENNKPELLQSGNDQYLIPGSNGKVISNNEITGSGGAIQVTVNNYGEPAEVQVQKNGNFVTIDMLPSAVTGIMQNDFANRGKARKTLENTSNLSNRTT
jgi:hypothetical protein